MTALTCPQLCRLVLDAVLVLVGTSQPLGISSTLSTSDSLLKQILLLFFFSLSLSLSLVFFFFFPLLFPSLIFNLIICVKIWR